MIKSKLGIKDTIGKKPKITTMKEALKLILSIASDKRGHVMKDDCINWLELKMGEIRKIAKEGIGEVNEDNKC